MDYTEKLKSFLAKSTGIPVGKIQIDPSDLSHSKYAKGESLLKGGDVCNQVIFILSGLIRSYYLKDGLEVNTGFFRENNIACSFTSLVNRVPSEEFLQTIETTEAISITFNKLMALYQIDPNWQKIGRIMTEKECVYLASRVSFLSFESAKEKYLTLLSDDPELVRRIPVGHLASYIGVSRETLSRIRSNI